MRERERSSGKDEQNNKTMEHAKESIQEIGWVKLQQWGGVAVGYG